MLPFDAEAAEKFLKVNYSIESSVVIFQARIWLMQNLANSTFFQDQKLH